jgi:hypothetical protein
VLHVPRQKAFPTFRNLLIERCECWANRSTMAASQIRAVVLLSVIAFAAMFIQVSPIKLTIVALLIH